MTKILDIIGLVSIAIMTLGFVGAFQPIVEPGLTILFWECAALTLVIIIYRKMKRRKEEKTD